MPATQSQASKQYRNEFTPNENGTSLDIHIDGYIGGWYGDTEPQSFKRNLERYPNVSQINLFITSLGGDPFAAITIGNHLAMHKANVTAYISGNAASAATVIPAIGANKIVMIDNAVYLIHDVSMSNWDSQTADDMRKGANELDLLSDQIAGIYATRSKTRNAKQFRAHMKENKWIDATQALEMGLVDELVSINDLRQPATNNKIVLTNYIDNDYENYQLPKPPKTKNAMSDILEMVKQALGISQQGQVILPQVVTNPSEETPEAPAAAVEEKTDPPPVAVPNETAQLEAFVNLVVAKLNAQKKDQQPPQAPQRNIQPIGNNGGGGMNLVVGTDRGAPANLMYFNEKTKRVERKRTGGNDASKLNAVEQFALNYAGLGSSYSNCGCNSPNAIPNSFDYGNFITEVGVCLREVMQQMGPTYQTQLPYGVTTQFGVQPNVEYRRYIAEFSSMLKNWKCDFEGNGDMEFNTNAIFPRAVKQESSFCPGEQWLDYFNFLMNTEAGFDPFNFPLAAYFVSEFVNSMLAQLVSPSMYFAQYNPNPATPNNLTVFDGIHTQLDSYITGANPVFNYPMPTLSALNAYDEIRTYAKFLQNLWWNGGSGLVPASQMGNIYVSPEVYNWIVEAMQQLQLATPCCDNSAQAYNLPSNGGLLPVKIPFTNFQIVPHWNMSNPLFPNSTQRIFATTTANYLALISADFGNAAIERCGWRVNVMGAGAAGFGFGIVDPRILSVTQTIVL